MEYDPHDPGSRRHLAARIVQTLLDAGFYEEWHGDEGDITKERVFTRAVDGVDGIRISVFTSVVEEECRSAGKDAIRVCALYRSERLGTERGIVSETRVHRVGDVDAICKRMLERMRSVWSAAKRPHRCPKCNAPTFKSKGGNDVCADLCWKSESEIRNDRGNRVSRSRRRYRGPRRPNAYWY